MQRSLRRVFGPCRDEFPADAMTDPSARLALFGGSLAASRLDVFERARTALLALSPDETASRTGACVRPGGVTVDFLGGTYDVDFARGVVRHLLSGPGAADDLTVNTLILHYLLLADGSPLSGCNASYREFPGAQIYYGPFLARTVTPLVGAFGARSHVLLQAGERLGGRPVPLGDAAVVLDVFPRLPMTFVVWSGDDEVPASGSVLFDGSAAGYLPLEDLVIAASLAVAALRRAAPEAPPTAPTGGGGPCTRH